MIFVKPYLEKVENTDDKSKKIELCGRLAYKSEDKITDASSYKFVKNIIKSKHYSVLEHSDVIIKVGFFRYLQLKLQFNKHLRFSSHDMNFLVSGNIRAWLELFESNPKKWNWIAESMIHKDVRLLTFFSDVKGVDYIHPEPISNFEVLTYDDLDEQELEVHERISYRFVVPRSISHEIVRHRVMSFIQESQRYCNYSKDKFVNTITFCIPHWCKSIKEGGASVGHSYTKKEELFIDALTVAEQAYFKLLEEGEKPEDARDILPNATKTEIIVTGYRDGWKHFLELRTPNSAHPEIRKLAQQIRL